MTVKISTSKGLLGCKVPAIILNHNVKRRFLRQLQVRPTIAVEGESSICIDADCELRHIFLLAPERITHTITCVGYVWECDSGCSFSNFLSRTLDLLVCNLHVLVEIHSAITWEVQVHPC